MYFLIKTILITDTKYFTIDFNSWKFRRHILHFKERFSSVGLTSIDRRFLIFFSSKGKKK